MESVASFIKFATGKTLGIAPYVGQCVMLFREWNIRNNGSEPYSAEGACNLWTTRGGHAYIWDGYDRIAAGAGRYGDFTIWSGYTGAYPNGGYGHVAMLLKDNGNGTGQFLSCNPGPVSERTLSYAGVLGHLRPKVAPPADQAPAAAGVDKLVHVKVEGAKYRSAPRLNAPVLQSFAAGAELHLKGHVTGDDASGNGDNAWGVGAFTGGYINLSTLVEDTITGLPYLG